MRRTWVALQRHDGIKQILIVLSAFWAYELTRMFIQPNWSAAMANARRVDDLERALNFAWEQSVQQTFLRVPELIEAMNVFYFVGHFVLTGVFFLWLYHSSRDGFRSFRNGFLVATAIASMSKQVSKGLVGVSSQTMPTSSRHSATRASRSVRSTADHGNPSGPHTLEMRRNVPP